MKTPLSKRITQAIPTAIMLVGIAWVLSRIMTAPFAFTASFLNSSKPSDFDFADFYNSVADGRPVRDFDDTVVIINMENSDRMEFALLLDELREFNPAAIGIDVLFQEPHDPSTDQWLMASLRGLPSVVMAESLIYDGKEFEVADRSFFADTIGGNIVFAASNLPTRVSAGTVRSFRAVYPTANGNVNGFASAIASKASAPAAERLTTRNNEQENINFPSRDFLIL